MSPLGRPGSSAGRHPPPPQSCSLTAPAPLPPLQGEHVSDADRMPTAAGRGRPPAGRAGPPNGCSSWQAGAVAAQLLTAWQRYVCCNWREIALIQSSVQVRALEHEEPQDEGAGRLQLLSVAAAAVCRAARCCRCQQLGSRALQLWACMSRLRVAAAARNCCTHIHSIQFCRPRTDGPGCGRHRVRWYCHSPRRRGAAVLEGRPVVALPALFVLFLAARRPYAGARRRGAVVLEGAEISCRS